MNQELTHLANTLAAQVEGEVRFDGGTRSAYSTDASNYRQIPLGVVLPKSAADVEATVAVCRDHDVPVLARGGGTSLAGQCCNVAVVIDCSKYYNRILEVDPERRVARVEPGVVLDDLRAATAPHGLTFGPNPATHSHCCLGGMLGNNACGIHSLLAGKTVDNVVEMEVLTYDGVRLTVGATSDAELAAKCAGSGRESAIYRQLRDIRDTHVDAIRTAFPQIPRRVSGYNLDELLPESGFHVARALVGSEGTCVTILEATLRLVPWPKARTLLVLGYADLYDAGDHVPTILESTPIGLEGMDHKIVGYMQGRDPRAFEPDLLPEGNGWLLVEFGGDSKEESDAQARDLMDRLAQDAGAPSMALYDDAEREARVWEVREAGLGASARLPDQPDNHPGWEDSAVHPETLGSYLRDLRDLFEKYGYEASLYGHFGDGCVHTRIPFDFRTRQGVADYKAFVNEAADLVVGYGGSLSGEHGDGQARGALLPKMYNPEIMDAFRAFKAAWDPQGRMNPGKLVDPNPLDAHLRLGTDYNPSVEATHFAYPEDSFDFARAVNRCVGVGKCRRKDGGTMCPSYMVTHEEIHSTRGRARLLHEMLVGDTVVGGWQSEEVKEALDLCLACKGCKSDCPVSVDMATYKAEFMARYYAGRPRPRSAYAFGFIMLWARLAARMPRLVNWAARTDTVARLAKWAAGIAPEREIPQFAEETFTHWYARRRGKAARPRREARSSRSPLTRAPQARSSLARSVPRTVVLWPDTFNDHFHPDVLRAALRLLEDAGFDVILPPAGLCCGRPLYDYGFLEQARDHLTEIVDRLRRQIRVGAPLVGLEPSCVATLRDELRNSLPYDEDARRLAEQSYLLEEFLVNVADYEPAQQSGRVLLHGHCHQKSVLDFGASRQILERAGFDVDVPDTGCCGMAGAFGFEAAHYDVATACGERVLLPLVRDADHETLIVTNGYSCREQVHQMTDRRTMHIAEVLARPVETA